MKISPTFISSLIQFHLVSHTKEKSNAINTTKEMGMVPFVFLGPPVHFLQIRLCRRHLGARFLGPGHRLAATPLCDPSEGSVNLAE